MIIFKTGVFGPHLTSSWSYLTDSSGLPCDGKITFDSGKIICHTRKKLAVLNLLLEVPKFCKVMVKTDLESHRQVDLLTSLINSRLQQIGQRGTRKPTLSQFSNLMRLGEKLALSQAEKLIKIKKIKGEFSDFKFGCQAFGINHGRKYKKLWLDNFDIGTIPLYFFLTNPNGKNPADWQLTDQIVNWLSANRKAIKGHPLVWLHRFATPDWLKQLSFNELKRFLVNHVKETVTRFGQTIKIWDIINEPSANDANGLNLTVDQLLEITQLISNEVKKIQPEAHRIINLSDVFGGKSWVHNRPSIPPLHFIKSCISRGIEFEGIGLQFYIGMRKEFACRELWDISQLLDQFAQFKKALHFSELGWPSKHDVDPDCFFNADHPEVAGRWHQPWSESLQADFLEKVFTVFASKPLAKSITWWDFTDKGIHQNIASRFIPFGGLTRKDLTPKPALITLKKFKKFIKS